MELYAKKGSALPQKIAITLIEIGLIAFAYFILFGGGEAIVAGMFGRPVLDQQPQRRWLILLFNVIVLLRMAIMMFVFLKRQMPWGEVFSVPIAYAIYYVGFAILILPNSSDVGVLDWVGIGVFALGSYLNTASEWQRHIFKSDPANKGKLYTGKLFAASMHINFFGDVLWVLGYAMIAAHIIGYGLALVLLAFFMFFNVPKLDAYLRDRYGAEFTSYEAKPNDLSRSSGEAFVRFFGNKLSTTYRLKISEMRSPIERR